MFPKHHIIRDPQNPIWNEIEQKKLEYSPLVMCSFFQGMDVLQLYGLESKEYIYGVYFAGRLRGTLYFGDLCTEEQIFEIKRDYFPENWEDIYEYVKEKSDVWYCKLDPSNYAFVLENPNILKKTS